MDHGGGGNIHALSGKTICTPLDGSYNSTISPRLNVDYSSGAVDYDSDDDAHPPPRIVDVHDVGRYCLPNRPQTEQNDGYVKRFLREFSRR